MLNSRIQTSLSPDARSPIFKILFIVRPSKAIDLLKLELSHQDYEIDVAHDCISGLLKYNSNQPHLVILDWHISTLLAADLCYRLRHKNSSILVLDTERRISDRVAALDAGADDCISLPLAMNEFLARVRVQLRKYIVYESSVLRFEDLKLDTSSREVYLGDRYIYLTAKEFALLEYFLAHPRQVLTRTQILDSVWGYKYTKDSNIVEVYIRYLRLKLEENNSMRLIHTVRGVGYILRESITLEH